MARGLAAAGLLVGLVGTATSARAATILVTTDADNLVNNGDCTLREAIMAANTDTAVDACTAGHGADSIILPAGVFILSQAGSGEDGDLTGDLDLTSDVTLDGAGRAKTTIDADGIDRAIDVVTGTVTIRQLTIQGGNAGSSFGGGVHLTHGSLALEAVRITDNLGNEGGGLQIEPYTRLSMLNSRLENNIGDNGGGLFVGAGATAVITASEVSSNTALFSEGGIGNTGVLTITNSTLSGNHAHQNGGGLLASSFAATHLYNVTIADNVADSDNNGSGDGGGLVNLAGTAFAAFNTLIGDNQGQSNDDCQSADPIPANQFDFNLLEQTAGCVITGTGSINRLGVAPNLAPLAFNGGGLQTQALLVGSPAIDAGDPAGCRDSQGAVLTTDQRGFARPIDGDADSQANCDIGAYEFNSPGAPTATPTVTLTRTPAPTATAVVTPDRRLQFLPLIELSELAGDRQPVRRP